MWSFRWGCGEVSWKLVDVGVAVGGGGGGGGGLLVPVARFSSPGTGSAMGGLCSGHSERRWRCSVEKSNLVTWVVVCCLIHALCWRALFFLFFSFFFFFFSVVPTCGPLHHLHMRLIFSWFTPQQWGGCPGGAVPREMACWLCFLSFTPHVSVYGSGGIMYMCINRMTCPDKRWTLIGSGLGALEVEICCFSFSIWLHSFPQEANLQWHFLAPLFLIIPYRLQKKLKRCVCVCVCVWERERVCVCVC